MSDHEERKEAREEKREERKEAREERREERKDHHGSHLGRREGHDERRAHDEVARVQKDLEDIVSKKEIHVHKTHEFLHKLHHAAMKLLRTHEDELDAAQSEASWVQDALDAIFDADKQSVALGKAITAASGSHTAKDADFEKDGVQTAIKALQADVDKAAKLIPDSE